MSTTKIYKKIGIFTLFFYITSLFPSEFIILSNHSYAASIPTTNALLVVQPYNIEQSSTGFTFDPVSGAYWSGPTLYGGGGGYYYVYYTAPTATFTYHGGTVKISSSPASFQQYKVDNGYIISVIRPDSSTVSRNSIIDGWTDDITSMFQAGDNTVIISLIDYVNTAYEASFAGNYRGSCGDWDVYSPGTYGKVCNGLYLLENYTVVGSTADMTSENGCSDLVGYPVCVDSGCKTFQASVPRTVCKDCWKWDKRYACSGTNYSAGDNSCLQGILTNSKTSITNAYSGCVTKSECVDLRPAATYTYNQDNTCSVDSPVTLGNGCVAENNITLSISQVTCQNNLNISVNTTQNRTNLKAGTYYLNPPTGSESGPGATINYTGGTVLLVPGSGESTVWSASSPGAFVLSITRPDSSVVNVGVPMSGGNCSVTASTSQFDITPYLQTGNNTISWSATDIYCGGQDWGGSGAMDILEQTHMSYTESWNDQCAAYNGDSTYKLVSGPTCIDGPSTKNIGGYNFTRDCWTYSSTYDHIVSQTQTITGCESYETQNNCYKISETCLDSTNPRTIQGFQITQPCWQWSRTYDCADTNNMSNGCSVYSSDPNCTLKSSTCTATLPSGDCQTYSRVYSCLQTVTQAEECLRYDNVLDCGGEMYCQNPDGCFNQTKNANKDFGTAMSTLKALDEINKEFTSMNIFKGEVNKCVSWDILGKECCDMGIDATTAMTLAGGYGAYSAYGAYTAYTAASTAYVTPTYFGVQAMSYGGALTSTGYIYVAGAAFTAFAAAYGVYLLTSPLLIGVFQCTPEEVTAGMKVKNKGKCVYVGEYCDNSTILGICLQKKKSYCCFESTLSKVIWEQGGAQVGKSHGSASSPDCSGFTVEQIQAMNWDAIDFTEYFTMVIARMPDLTTDKNRLITTIQDAASNLTQPPH
jgi:hypothetical protein